MSKNTRIMEQLLNQDEQDVFAPEDQVIYRNTWMAVICGYPDESLLDNDWSYRNYFRQQKSWPCYSSTPLAGLRCRNSS